MPANKVIRHLGSITVVLRRCKKRKVTKFSKKMVDEVNVSKAYK